ncbi:MAG: adenylyl-sulfate kinase [Proteobacteria bacterium]|nr:adenylyl-sulfate kinase [Pseudomonadota bacterium]
MPDQTTIAAQAAATSATSPLRVVFVGHVDHGKSTLVGRLLHEMGALPDGAVARVEESCHRRGMAFEWAFVTDALQVERDQGVTVDLSYIRFRSARRPYVLIDAPGHREFIRNMVTGAGAADAAVLVIDAAEGVREQSRRHGLLVQLLGVRQIVVAVNKMDLVGHAEARFAEIVREFAAYLGGLGLKAQAMIPTAARDGDNLTTRSPRLNWYRGPILVEALDRLDKLPAPVDLPLRLPVQDVYKFDDRRILAGRIASGRLAIGDTVLFSPCNKTTRIKTIEAWSPLPDAMPPRHAVAGQAVGVTLTDELFLERGETMSHVERPPVETTVFRARLFWLGATPLAAGRRLTLKLATQSCAVEVQSIDRVIGADLTPSGAAEVAPYDVAEAVLRTRRLLALDPYSDNPATGRFVLAEDGEIVGGGTIGMQGYSDQRPLVTPRAQNVAIVEHRVSTAARTARSGHAGGVLWLTGLSAAGKSTLAIAVEQRLFQLGYQVFVLDGDNLRHGLSADLGFNPAERAENIRRVGEVAALFAEAGFITIAAFISPYRADRERARAAAERRAEGSFHEIYVRADLATCERRDPRGLYKKARTGQIPEFTGISAPYEPPEAAALIVDTADATVEGSVEQVLRYVAAKFSLHRAGS